MIKQLIYTSDATDDSIFQFRYEPEGAGVQVTSASGLIGLKKEV